MHRRSFGKRICYSVQSQIKISKTGRDGRTSKRALSTENGLSRKPTVTRVVAPARRLP